MKIKMIALLTFLISFNCTAHAYTVEDLESMRLKTVLASVLIDACFAFSNHMDPPLIADIHVFESDQKKLIRRLQEYNYTIHAALSAALEKESSIFLPLVANIMTALKIAHSQNKEQQKQLLKEIIAPLIPKIVNTILFLIIKKGLYGKNFETVRRIFRVLIATATRTAIEVLVDKFFPSRVQVLFAEVQMSRNWTTDQIIAQACINCAEATAIETLGALIAANIKEKKVKSA